MRHAQRTPQLEIDVQSARAAAQQHSDGSAEARVFAPVMNDCFRTLILWILRILTLRNIRTLILPIIRTLTLRNVRTLVLRITHNLTLR